MTTSRSVTSDDLPAVTDLQRRYDTSWFGSPEHDEQEMRETLERVPEGQSLAVFDGDLAVGLAHWSGTDNSITVDPATDVALGEIVDWYTAQPAPQADALDRDSGLRSALERRGWTHHHSSVELVRTVSPEWVLAEPVWPDRIEVRSLADGDEEAIHHLIYRDAGWTEVPGHPDRAFAEWRPIFLTDQELPEQQVLAWLGHDLVGASIGRTWSDGTGWVSQLAVAKSQRARGLGRALLLESLRRRVAGGAQALGLSVEVLNRTALALYLDVGLEVDREWMTFTR